MVDATTWVAIGSLGACASTLFVAHQAALASRALRETAKQQRQALEMSLRTTAAPIWLTAEISHYGLWEEHRDAAKVFPVRGDVGDDLLIRAYVRAIAENRSKEPVRLTLRGQLPFYTLHPYQNWVNPDNNAIYSHSLNDSPNQWFGNYLSSKREYLQLKPGEHVFIHYRTYLSFDAWRFQYYRRHGREALEPLGPLARSCMPRRVLRWHERLLLNPAKVLAIDLGPGIQLVCDSYEAERLATVWTVRLRASAVTPIEFDHDTQTWLWDLAEPPTWEETGSDDLYCGYQLVPVSRRITGSKVLVLPGQE